MNENRLLRSETDKWIAGVCGGLSSYVNIDPVIVRGLFTLLLFASGIGIPLYFILWVIMPTESHTGNDAFGENLKDMGNTVSERMNTLGKPSTVGTMFIMLGAFFLLHELGILASGFFWPLLIIGIGVYLLRNRSNSED